MQYQQGRNIISLQMQMKKHTERIETALVDVMSASPRCSAFFPQARSL